MFSPRIRLALIAVCAVSLLALSASCPRQSEPTEPEKGAPALRIVSLSPGVTEILFALGLGERVVGVCDFSTYPPQAIGLPRVGSLFNTDYEAITLLEPDLVIHLISDYEAPDKLAVLKIRSLAVGSETMPELYGSIDAIAEALGEPQRGKQLSERIRGELEHVHGLVADLPQTRALLCVGHSPGTLQDVYAAAPGSFISELAVIAGAQNIVAPVAPKFPRINKETIIVADPQVIVVLMTDPSAADPQQERELWATLGPLSAVKNDRVHQLSAQGVSVAGPRVGELALVIAGLLHPQINLDPASGEALSGAGGVR
ncbi:MAG: helical backbone metal receptor [Candidatus Alcyoniella australis]|nr:helical backbone metal receptor [Candidatus Alcyoniella australis]